MALRSEICFFVHFMKNQPSENEFSVFRIFSLLSAILHLGNIRYKKKTYRDDSIDICNPEILPVVSELLEVRLCFPSWSFHTKQATSGLGHKTCAIYFQFHQRESSCVFPFLWAVHVCQGKGTGTFLMRFFMWGFLPQLFSCRFHWLKILFLRLNVKGCRTGLDAKQPCCPTWQCLQLPAFSSLTLTWCSSNLFQSLSEELKQL